MGKNNKETVVIVDKGGSPPYYDDPEELARAIDEYFKKGINKKKILVGKERLLMEMEVPTITGLCYYLGFASRQSFYDYEKRSGFSYIINRARLFIEREYEEQLQHGNTTGAIFALKNMGWYDRTEHTGKDGSSLHPDAIELRYVPSGKRLLTDESQIEDVKLIEE